MIGLELITVGWILICCIIFTALNSESYLHLYDHKYKEWRKESRTGSRALPDDIVRRFQSIYRVNRIGRALLYTTLVLIIVGIGRFWIESHLAAVWKCGIVLLTLIGTLVLSVSAYLLTGPMDNADIMMMMAHLIGTVDRHNSGPKLQYRARTPQRMDPRVVHTELFYSARSKEQALNFLASFSVRLWETAYVCTPEGIFEKNSDGTISQRF
jgi:hypothetical protein